MRRRPPAGLLAAIVLALPAAITVPTTLAARVRDVHAERRLPPGDVRTMPVIRGGVNRPLLGAALRLIPPGSELAYVPGGRFVRPGEPLVRRQYRFLERKWTRWLTFALTPRVVVAGRPARWAIVFGARPQAVGILPRQAWRFGRDYVVRTTAP
jgi:hypothetical protein